MNAKFVFILFLSLYVSKCLNVSPAPSTTYMRSELPVKRLEIELTNMLPLTLLCVCIFLHFLPQIDLNCRFITFDTQLNTLPVSVRERRLDNFNFCLLVLSYFLIFEYYFVVFLPFNLNLIHLDTRRIAKVVTLFKILHISIISTASQSYIHLAYITISYIYHFPFEIISIWLCLMHLIVSRYPSQPGACSLGQFHRRVSILLQLEHEHSQ